MSNHMRPTGSVPVVGMVGGGQLARMTQQAAVDLDVELVVLARTADEPALLAGATPLLGAPDDADALARLAHASDVVTFDHEHVPNDLVAALTAKGFAVRPAAGALRAAQDKLFQRQAFAAAGFPVPVFTALGTDAMADLDRLAEHAGWPLVLKARTGGYDGRGVFVAPDREAARAFCAGRPAGSLLAEALVPIAMEVAVVGARRPSGQWAPYPVVETRQVDGICRELVMPARIDPEVAKTAAALAEGIARHLDASGILAVELFVTGEGQVLVNEIALRPHNSGHATIEGSVTSQFHNHLRAVLDWPLGSTAMRAPAAAMVNILGGRDGADPRARLPAALARAEASVHLYGKAAAPGRKLGHVTALGRDGDEALDAARACVETLTGEPVPTAGPRA